MGNRLKTYEGFMDIFRKKKVEEDEYIDPEDLQHHYSAIFEMIEEFAEDNNFYCIKKDSSNKEGVVTLAEYSSEYLYIRYEIRRKATLLTKNTILITMKSQIPKREDFPPGWEMSLVSNEFRNIPPSYRAIADNLIFMIKKNIEPKYQIDITENGIGNSKIIKIFV